MYLGTIELDREDTMPQVLDLANMYQIDLLKKVRAINQGVLCIFNSSYHLDVRRTDDSKADDGKCGSLVHTRR